MVSWNGSLPSGSNQAEACRFHRMPDTFAGIGLEIWARPTFRVGNSQAGGNTIIDFPYLERSARNRTNIVGHAQIVARLELSVKGNVIWQGVPQVHRILAADLNN
jgi:hypothetical protein